MPNPPLVSVSVLSYQHEDFLAQAVESALAQETCFDVEIVIGVDGGGDDRTAEIARTLASEHANVRAIIHPVRGAGIPGRVNNVSNLAACRGKYIAMLDGDDYWVDRRKLARQVAVLERDAFIGLVFHDVEVFYDDPQHPAYSFFSRGDLVDDPNRPRTYNLVEIAQRGHSRVPTSSMMFRASAIHPLPTWFHSILAADFALQLLACHGAKAHYLPIRAGRYRKHASSVTQTIWRNRPNFFRKLVELDVYSAHFDLDREFFNRMRAWVHYDLVESYWPTRKSAALYHLAQAARRDPFVSAKRLKDSLLHSASSLAPPRPARAPFPESMSAVNSAAPS